MGSAQVEDYAAVFLARCDAARRPGQPRVDEGGIAGLLGSDGDPRVRLLVTDDRALERLAELLPAIRAGTVEVLERAERCTALLDGEPAWRSERSTAMVCTDLAAVPEPDLPAGLTLRGVRRLPDEPPDGVALEEAAAAAMRADRRIEGPAADFVGFLRSMPAGVRLHCAVDGGGVVRATSGAGTAVADASVFFVNTDPAWRRRGVGAAMTAVAVRSAREAGARRASLQATDAGLSVYLRLGFDAVGRARRFSLPYRSGS